MLKFVEDVDCIAWCCNPTWPENNQIQKNISKEQPCTPMIWGTNAQRCLQAQRQALGAPQEVATAFFLLLASIMVKKLLDWCGLVPISYVEEERF